MLRTTLRPSGIRVLLGLALLSAVAGAEIQVQDTVLFATMEGQLRQMLHVTGLPEATAACTIELAGVPIEIPARQLQPYKRGVLVPAPPVDAPTPLRLAFAQGASATHTVRPQKRWTAYLTPHTHFDVGFTDVQPRVWDNLMANLRNVLVLCDETDRWPEGVRYRWTIEVSALFEEFERRYPEDALRLVARMHEGRVELGAMYLNLLSELCGEEELVRSLYPAARLRTRYGIRVESAMHNDVPGLTWQMPQLLTGAGVRYLSLRANPVRAKFLWYRPEAPVRPFLWEAPDGTRLFTWYTDSYREANFFRAECPETAMDDFLASDGRHPYDQLLGLIARQEEKGTPVDAMQLRMGGDNLTSTLAPCRWARAWNARWAWPRLVIATNRMFFEAVEPFRDRLPVHRGDIPNWWADGAGSAARETGINRENDDRAGTAEALAALVESPAAGDTWGLYREMLLYDEHTFGSSAGGRERDPAQAREQWAIKSGYAHTADRASRALLEAATATLGDAVRRQEGPRLVVWNPSSWPRSGVVRVLLPEGHVACESDTSAPLPVQRTGDESAVYVREVPPLGWRAYDVRPGQAAPKTGERSSPPADAVLPTYLYETGAVREKHFPLDAVPRFDKARSTAEPPALGAEHCVEHGDVFSRWEVDLDHAAGARTVRLGLTTAGDGRIDVDVFIDKEETEAVEGVYLRFPFALGRPTARVDLPFGWMDPTRDRLPCTCGDFFSIDRTVDLNDGRRGVTLAAVEAPLVQLGRITTDAWSDTVEIDEATVYGYVMNNAWFTNYPISQGGPHTFRYALRQYDGAFDPVAASRFGEEVSRPLVPLLVEAGAAGSWADRDTMSLLALEPDAVRVTAVKPAEDGRGLIVRLLEGAGDPAHVRLAAPGLGPCEFQHCTPVEQDRGLIDAADGIAVFALRPWEVATVRVVPR